MTTPPTPPKQSNAKAWIAVIVTLLGSLAPIITQVAGVLPAPWGAILTGIAALVGLVTGTAVHQVSNAPTGMVLVPVPVPDGAQTNPYK
jgi:predicted benzoate:H+ symporter BenE